MRRLKSLEEAPAALRARRSRPRQRLLDYKLPLEHELIRVRAALEDGTQKEFEPAGSFSPPQVAPRLVRRAPGEEMRPDTPEEIREEKDRLW